MVTEISFVYCQIFVIRVVNQNELILHVFLHCYWDLFCTSFDLRRKRTSRGEIGVVTIPVSSSMRSFFPLKETQLSRSLTRFYHQTNISIAPSHLHPTNFPLNSAAEKPTHPFLYLLDSTTTPLTLHKIHGLLVVHGLTRSLPFQTKLLSTYGSAGNIARARKVFDEIPSPDLYSCKAMLKCYLTNHCYVDVIRFFRHMRGSDLECDNVVFSHVLKACIRSLDLNEGKKLHCYVIKAGSPDIFLMNVFIDMYAKCGDLESSLRLFEGVSDKNVVSWTSVITGCNQNGHPEHGLVVFNQMRLTRVGPEEHTMGSVLTSCSMVEALHQGKWVHGFVLKTGLCRNNFVVTSLLDMYVKCGEVTDARSFFDELDNVDLVMWTAMIVGYAQRGCPSKALKLFCDKKWASLVPNSVTISSALSASGKLGVLVLGRSIHVLVFKLGLQGVEEVRNSLVDMYAKCSAIPEAKHVFESILNKDVIAWNTMISGYSQNHFGHESLELFNRMRSGRCLPDAVTVVSALSACACLGDVSIGSCLHGYAAKCCFLSNVYVCTALLNLYNKCGDSVSARKVFDDSRNRNTVTWSAMIGGYGMQGDPNGSLDLFSRMLGEELKPNDVTFTTVLSACSHAGMVDEGLKYFESMTRSHNIVPSRKHYVCMVDMLARAGKLDEALEFVEGMPIRGEVSVWGALLNGCGLHSRLDIGEVAVRRMVELEPETPDYYVLMSNLYASDGRWTEAKRIRELMKEKGMTKTPGSSFVSRDKALDRVAVNG